MVDKEDTTIKLSGRLALNRSIQGDTVVIELLPKQEWSKSLIEVVQDTDDEKDNDELVDDAAIIPTDEIQMDVDEKESLLQSQNNLIKPMGRVVGIIKRNTRSYCGTISTSAQIVGTTARTQTVTFHPIDKRIPIIKIKTRQANVLMNKRIMVHIDSWPVTSRFPLGHFTKSLGDVGEKTTETQVLLLEHDVPFLPFTPAVLSSLPVEGEEWVVTESDLLNRRDLRYLDVCSIDPPGCTDIDDALHARLLPNGNYEVGVHIADVSHFVKSKTAMDEEAARRGTTVYLVDKRIDMLPPLLGTSKFPPLLHWCTKSFRSLFA